MFIFTIVLRLKSYLPDSLSMLYLNSMIGLVCPSLAELRIIYFLVEFEGYVVGIVLPVITLLRSRLKGLGFLKIGVLSVWFVSIFVGIGGFSVALSFSIIANSACYSNLLILDLISLIKSSTSRIYPLVGYFVLLCSLNSVFFMKLNLGPFIFLPFRICSSSLSSLFFRTISPSSFT